MSKGVSQMTNDEFMEFVVHQSLKGWIPLRTYLRLFPEEKKTAIESRVKRGYWQRGVHYSRPHGSVAWVNVIAIGEWAARDNPAEPGADDQ